MRARHLIAISAALVAVASGSASAATGRSADPALSNAQTIVGSTGSSTRAVVSITKPVVIPADVTAAGCSLSRSVRVVGSAQQSLLFLTSLPLTPNSTITWVAHVRLGSSTQTVDSACLGTTLPAGRYLLQYVHSPGTSEMTLRLPGLKGASRLKPAGRDGSQIAALPPVLATAASPSTYAWGTRRSLPTRGSVLTVGAIKAAAPGAYEWIGYGARGDCLLDSSAAALPDHVAYAPGCPAGGSGTAYGNTGTSSWTATLTSNLPPDSYGAGFWYVTTPTTTPLGAVSVWLTNFSS
jgi:hypothetical protein